VAIKEEVYYEGGPHKGDLILGVVLIFTVVCIPISVGAIVRALWLRYRITDRRVSVTGGWMGNSRVDIIYSEIRSIASVARGFGGWGDIVLTLRDGSLIEMRAMPNFREAATYIEIQAEAKSKGKQTQKAA
jgi:Bacterial PH domain